MNRRCVWIVVATTLTSLLFATVATSGGVGLWGAPQWDPAPRDSAPLEIDTPFESGQLLTPPDDPLNEPSELPGWLEAVLQVIIVVIVFIAVVAMVVVGWRNRPRVRWRRASMGEGDFDVLPDIAAAVVEHAAAQRAALLSGAPRNAIVQCWMQLEADVAAAGLTRDPADTSLEFTERVLARYTVDSEAISELAALYREARFSDHPLQESHRRAALDALDRLHQTLDGSPSGAAP
jgi:hypothetical protein